MMKAFEPKRPVLTNLLLCECSNNSVIYIFILQNRQVSFGVD